MEKADKNKLYRMYFYKKMTMSEIGKKYHISPSAVAKRMDKYGLERRGRSEATYVSYNKKECFCIRPKRQEILKEAALMLYWCEGTNYAGRNKKNGTLAFTNTNADMLKIWLKFLKNVCNLNNRKIKIRIYIHKNQNGHKLIKYWSKILKVPIANFENVSYTKKNSTRPDYKGTVKIKVHNIKLFATIQGMILNTVNKILTN